MYIIMLKVNIIIGDIMKIEDVMTKGIITCHKNDSIKDVALIMKKYDIGFLPIIDNNKIIGTVTDRDLIINEFNDIINKQNELITINYDKNIDEALNIMSKNKVKRLIVTKDNKAIGIVSLSDLVNHTNKEDFTKAFKQIYAIDKNNHYFNTDIDEFYL